MKIVLKIIGFWGALTLVACNGADFSSSTTSTVRTRYLENGAIKTCTADVPSLEDNNRTQRTTFQIFRDKAVIEITVDGEKSSYEDKAKIEKHKVRAGLSADSNGVNIGEALIINALSLENDPIFAGRFSSGLNLSKVRTVNVYIVGSVPTDAVGITAIVEAFDELNNPLGSFLAGFLIAPCK